jgi:Putative MetA-pathway of phenol degradation
MCLVFVLPARAQQSAPSASDTADRPGFADSPVLLRGGQIQIESGLSWEHAGRGAGLAKILTWPQLELHAGVAPRLEVSLAWDGLVSTVATSSVSKSDRRSTGWADLRLGAKFGLVTCPDIDAALIGYVDLPVGSDTVSSGYADPLVRFAWGISVSDRVGLSGTVDLGAAREADDRVRPKPALGASLGTSVVGTLNGFVGMVAESPAAGSRPDVWSVEAGVVLPLGVRTQIDVWVSRRVAGGPDDWFLGAGFVRRLR